jgi:hypothetical protein
MREEQQPGRDNGERRSLDQERPAVLAEDDDEDPGGSVLGVAFVDYLKTERGHELAGRVVDLFEGVKKATLDERSRAKALDSEIEKLTLRHTWMLKTLGLLLITSAIVGLSVFDRLTPAAGTILGAIAGYILGQPGQRISAK